MQRMRILGAMAEVACTHGLESTTVARVVARAGVSRRTFYDVFESRGGCFLELFDETVTLARERVTPAWVGQARWIDRVRAALTELLCFLDEEPELARACVVQALSGGPAVLDRRRQILRSFALAVDQGSMQPRAAQPPPLTAEGVVGAVFSIVHARLLEDRREPLIGLLGSLMAVIALPYLGPAAARRESARAAAPPPAVEAATPSFVRRDTRGALGVRVTYRTLRVLAVIAERPGASNRVVGAEAGVSDQGQMSRLLTRLESLGLVANRGEGHSRGATNAWHLTEKGTEVHSAVRCRAA